MSVRVVLPIGVPDAGFGFVSFPTSRRIGDWREARAVNAILGVLPDCGKVQRCDAK
jgi:hypothetical protein